MHPGGNVQLAVGCPAMYSNIYIASSDASVPDAIITIESTGAISIN